MESVNKNQVTLYRSSHWEVLCKRYVRFCQVSRSVLDEKVILKGGCFFPFILPVIRTGSLYQKFRCSGIRIMFRTGTFLRIFNFSTKLLDLPENCKSLAANFARVLEICSLNYNPEYLRTQEKRRIFNRTPNFVSVPPL